MKRIVGTVCMACFMLLLIGAAWTRSEMPREADGQREDNETELTVWLDDDNEYEVRSMLALHEKAKNNELLKPDGAEPLDIKWNLVPKGYLSPEQYRKELMDALENGEGPDFIYMDAYNGVNPKDLVKAGALAQLEDSPTRYGKSFAWAPGALEAGTQDGKNYVLPLYMECPVVFGFTDSLEQAGLRADGAYGSLGEFLDALLTAREKTGKMVFEDDAAIDWLERYYMPDDAARAEELKGKLERLRAFCGDNDGNFDAYKELDAGNCLLGGCGIYDYKALGKNLSLFSEKQPLSLFSIPDSEGNVKGIITHSVAVNARSKNAKAARDSIFVFLSFYKYWAPDMYVMDNDRFGDLLSGIATLRLNPPSVLPAYADGKLPGNAVRDFEKCTLKAVNRAAYAQEFGDRIDDDNHAEGTDARRDELPQTLYIYYADHGEGDKYPLTEWLENVAASYWQSHHDARIRLLPVDIDEVSAYLNYLDMDNYNLSPDMQMIDMTYLMESENIYADFSDLFTESAAELEFLPDIFQSGIQYNGRTQGLPLWAEEYGIWCSRKKLAQAGLSEKRLPESREEFAEWLKKLRGVLKKKNAAAVMPYDTNTYQAMALFLSGAPDGLFVRQEDGKWRCSKEGWADYLSCLKEWQEEKLIAPDEKDDKKRLAMSLASGKIGAVVGSRRLAPWFGGSYGSGLTVEQQEDIVFLPLFPGVGVQMFVVSKKSGNTEALFNFWKEAIQSPDYVAAMREQACLPVTEKDVKYVLPDASVEQINALHDLIDELWKPGASVAELLEKHACYDWTEE